MKQLSVIVAFALLLLFTPGLLKAQSSMKAVDLGLSVKWASCNLEASAPEEYGNYYAWGEIETKRYYSWATYKYAYSKYDMLTKYCPLYKSNLWAYTDDPDNKTVLDREDDVAHVKLGFGWRMPTNEEWTELSTECTWEQTQVDGVYGYKVTGSTGESIFLPAAGYREDGRGSVLRSAGLEGAYWSSSLCPNTVYKAYGLYFNMNVYWDYTGSGDRCEGRSVRPVFISEAEVKARAEAEDRAKKEAEQKAKYEAKYGVDLGLSVKWASCNLGASAPEEYGDYYAWGEIETGERLAYSKYDNELTKYNVNSYYGRVDGLKQLRQSDDVAHVKLGGSWRMPTHTEQVELRDKCTWTWTKVNGVKGYKVTGPNGNSIFLPATGDGHSGEGFYGRYWSSSLFTEYPTSAYSLNFNPDRVSCDTQKRHLGISVRPVSE